MREYRWYTITQASRYFGKDPSVILRWCHAGTLLDAQCVTRRDLTGHWFIGIPLDSGVTANPATTPLSVDNLTY